MRRIVTGLGLAGVVLAAGELRAQVPTPAPSPSAAEPAAQPAAQPGVGLPVRGTVRPLGAAASGDVTAALLTAKGERVGVRLVPASGRFELRAPAPGSYRVALFRVGYERVVSAPVTVAANAPVPAVELAAPAARVALLGAVRTAERGTCSARLGTGATADATARTTALLWEQVRTALDATVLATQEGALDATLLSFDRDRDGRGRVRRDSSSTESVRVREPYVTRPAAELVERGFARRDGPGELSLFVPDGRVLLDERFLATHCYGLRDDRPPQPGWVGLTFAPVSPRGVPDIEGTLWVEQATAELRTLEYRYVGLPEPWASLVGPLAEAGGEVRFVRLPSGLWVVRAWHVRLPVPAARPIDPLSQTKRYAVERVWENGGELLDARRVDAGAALTATGTAQVRVTIAATVRVVDERGTPVADAEVAVDTGAVSQAARTDSAGAVQLPALAAGARRLAVRAVGFTPIDTVYTIPPEPDLTLTVAIGRIPVPGAQMLPITRVVERRVSLLESFERRRRAGLGVYMTAADLEKRKVRRITDAFVGIPGVQVSGGIVSMPRPGFGGPRALTEACLTTVYVDGARAMGMAAPVVVEEGTNRMIAEVAAGPTGNAEMGGQGYQSPFLGIQPGDVAAIEVYRGLGVTPPEFAGMGSACGTIVVWTKRGLSTQQR
jgi:hypothetical protein